MKIKITNKDSVPEFVRVFINQSGVQVIEQEENGKKVYQIVKREVQNGAYSRSNAGNVRG